MQETMERTSVRPVFAACVFGFCIVLIVLFAALLFAKSPLIGLSALAPCLPLAYFAVRGFRHGRVSAFEAMPQRWSAFAAVALVFAGILLGYLGGNWGLSIGPMIGAVLFAYCTKSFREFMLIFP